MLGPGTLFLNRRQARIRVGMTCASAVSEFADGIQNSRLFDLLMRTCLVVIDMTAGTIGTV